LIRILAGLEKPDSGRVAGIDTPPATLLHLGIPSTNLTVLEELWLYAVLYGIPSVERRSAIRKVLELVGLDARKSCKVSDLSDAQVAASDLARALLSPSNILLLDEPMLHLDKPTRTRVWEYLLSAKVRRKKIIIMASSNAEDAEMCDRVVLLHEGRTLAVGTPFELCSIVGQEALIVTPIGKPSKNVEKCKSAVVAKQQDGSFLVECVDKTKPLDVFTQVPAAISAVRIQPCSLDSVLEELIARNVRKQAVDSS
jgi:ABC-type multidrug transport system ATPase subunit